ncbi:MAG: hypothetical protein HKN76_05930 [Saprospiraceae bacterium]|nr:hypothetical protein [Saprospiraceae bacterium]
MKWIKLFIAVTSVFIHASGQNLEQTFTLAQNQFEKGEFYQSEKTYKRVLFFDSSNIFRGRATEKLAHISIVKNDLQEALNYFDQAYFSISNQQIRTDIQFERIQLFIETQEFQKALAELYQVDIIEGNAERIALYEGYCQYLLKDFEAARSAFLILAQDSLVANNINQKIKRALQIEKMNPKTYQILSYIVPGLGQILLGETKNSINSILLNTGLTLLFIETARKLSLFDATLSVIPWFYRYYAGGAKLTKDLAIEKKQRRHEENLSQLIASVTD